MRGSVYPYTTKRGERRWRVVFDTLPDPLTGQRRQTSKRGFATKAAAEAFLRRSLGKVTSGTYTQPSRVTLAEYLAEWLDGLRKKPTTMVDYRQSARVYIGPRIGGVPLQSLTPEHLDRLYRELETRGKRAGRCATAGVTCREHECSPDRHGGLSPKTVRNVHNMLHRALQEAAGRGHVPRNVASLAHPPTAKQARSHNTRDCQDGKRRCSHEHTSFTFLGYAFRSRKVRARNGSYFFSFNPAISDEAAKRIRAQIRSWRLHLRSGSTLQDLAREVNLIVRGWINYYGRFYRSALVPSLNGINAYLVRWAMQKYKRLRRHRRRARQRLVLIARSEPALFAHWQSRWCQSAAVDQRRGHRDQGILAQLARRPVRPQAAASDARISAT